MHPPLQTTRRVLPPGKHDRRVMSPFAKYYTLALFYNEGGMSAT